MSLTSESSIPGYVGSDEASTESRSVWWKLFSELRYLVSNGSLWSADAQLTLVSTPVSENACEGGRYLFRRWTRICGIRGAPWGFQAVGQNKFMMCAEMGNPDSIIGCSSLRMSAIVANLVFRKL
jgi:hypothetical protein